MKTILVPTDYSDASRNAMWYAVELAKFENAKILLFHAYLPRVLLSSLTLIDGGFEEEHKSVLERYKREIKIKSGRIPKVEVLARAGLEVAEILSVIKERKISKVVMGMTGSGLVKDILMGNTAISVMQKTQIPVLIIPEGVTFKIPERIALAIENDSPLPEKLTKTVKSLLDIFDSKLLLYNMIQWRGPVFFDDETVVFHRDPLYEIEHELYLRSGEDLTASLEDFIESKKVDLLVMMPKSHSYLSRLFHRSNTKRMAFHSHIPLLSIHE